MEVVDSDHDDFEVTCKVCDKKVAQKRAMACECCDKTICYDCTATCFSCKEHICVDEHGGPCDDDHVINCCFCGEWTCRLCNSNLDKKERCCFRTRHNSDDSDYDY